MHDIMAQGPFASSSPSTVRCADPTVLGEAAAEDAAEIDRPS